MILERPDGSRHLAGEDDVRATLCGLWIGDETWRGSDDITAAGVSCSACRDLGAERSVPSALENDLTARVQEALG